MLGIAMLPLFCHARHSLHLSTIGFIIAKRTSSIPAACNISRCLDSLACHRLRCSSRTSRWTTAGL
eukprot:5924663-Karenia_brevis.AAC.1